MPAEYGDEPTISAIVRELEPGRSVVFDSGMRGGSITVARSKLAPLSGAFVVSGVTSTTAGLSADEAQADVGRRRRIRDDAKDRRAERAKERGFGS